MTDYPALRLLLQGYLHLDWPEVHGDVWQAVAAFARREPEKACALPAEVRQLLASARTEAELRAVVVDQLGSGYLPEGAGWGYRAWLAAVATRVESHPR